MGATKRWFLRLLIMSFSIHKETFPEKLLRGISSSDFVDDEGRATAALFQFDKSERSDGFDEVSVNWYDNMDALDILLNQRKKSGEDYQFRIGVAVLCRNWLDELIRRPNNKNAIDYERDPIEDVNPHHGNILRKASLPNGVKSMLASNIAFCVENIIYRDLA